MKTVSKKHQDKNVRSEEELTEMDIREFRASFCPYGYMDIERAVKVCREAGLTVEDLIEEINEYCESCGVSQDKVDPVAQAYDMILQRARTQIDNATGKDICNDVKEEIHVAGNFMCTQFDYTQEAKEEFLQIIAEIPEEDRSEELKFIVSEIQ